MLIKVEFDKTFKEAWGENSLFAIRGILACVQNIYRWSSWNVKLEFKLTREIEYNPRKSFELKNYRPDDMEKCKYAPLLQLGYMQNDRDADINIYYTNEKDGTKKPGTLAIAGTAPQRSICHQDLNYNVVIVSAEHGDMYGLKPPKHNQKFPSIATHALVKFNYNE